MTQLRVSRPVALPVPSPHLSRWSAAFRSFRSISRSPNRVALLVALAAALTTAQAAAAQETAPRPFLFKDARGELARFQAIGDTSVLVVVASAPGANADVAAQIMGWGGEVQFRADDVDYLRARVPVERVEELASAGDVVSVEVSITGWRRVFGMAERADGPVVRDGTSVGESAGGGRESLRRREPDPADRRRGGAVPGQGAGNDTVWPPILSPYPLTSRYSPLEDIGAAEFLRDHPTWDGRGVTVAMIDLSPDPLLPELQVARDLEGNPVPKIATYRTVTDAVEEPDGRWLEMDDEVTVGPAGTFVHDGTTHTAPRPGTFRMDVLNEETFDSLSNAGVDDDLNRDGNPDGSSRLFGVLWDPASDEVWVDTDQDHAFTDETALTEYAVRPEFGVLGTDDPSTEVRESVGFGVQIDREDGRVGLNMGVASHASLVVGAAVASRGEHGRFDGVAPGARLASVAEGGSAYGQTEAAIVAARDADADVIFFEQSSGITRDYLLRDGRLVPTVIYARLVDRYGAVIVSPTHNYPVLGAPDDFVVARGVIGIGGHESRENFFRNHGIRVRHRDNLLVTGGYGPMGNGALEPDVISPSNYVSTARGFLEGESIEGLFQLPPGYTIAGGTSTATPTAAGAVALLISAARQAGVEWDPYRIAHAVATSARWVPHIAPYKQGNGVINVAGAWEILKALARRRGRVDIDVRAPVRHEYSHLLPTPHEGVGLYEREGWAPGDRGERVITLTRTSGPPEPMTFRLTWLGDDEGAFAAPPTVTLPLDEPVPVTVEISPHEAGVHTAHLTLEHPDVPGYAHRMLAAIVAPEPLDEENGFTVEMETEVPRPGMRSFFFRVPEGADALRVQVDAPERGVSLAVVRPDTRQAARAGGDPDETGTSAEVITNPPAGTWEVRLGDVADTRTFDWEQARDTSALPPTPVTLTVSAISVGAATPATTTDDDGSAGNGAVGAAGAGPERTVTLTNRMATTTVGAETTPMGSARRDRATLRHKEQRVYEVDVPEGTTALLVRTGGLSDPEADLDVYVFDCTDEEEGCQGARADGDPGGEEVALVEDPEAGAWKIVVDAFEAPAGSVTFDYVDVLLNPTFGTVGVADVPGERQTGTQWPTTVHPWATARAAESGREPSALVRIMGRPEEGPPFLIGHRPLEPTPTWDGPLPPPGPWTSSSRDVPGRVSRN